MNTSQILINKNAQVFYVDFRPESNIFILFIIKNANFLVGKQVAFGNDEKLQSWIS